MSSFCCRKGGTATENTLSVDGNLRLRRATGRSDLRVLLDTQNPALWGHAVAPMVDGLWRYLVDKVHVKDGIDGVMGNAVTGEGDSGFAAKLAALRRRGFRVTIVGSQPYPDVPPGTVVRQQPDGGFQVAAGEPISLEVSR